MVIDAALEAFENIIHDLTLDDETVFKRLREAVSLRVAGTEGVVADNLVDHQLERLLQIQLFIEWRRPGLAIMMRNQL